MTDVTDVQVPDPGLLARVRVWWCRVQAGRIGTAVLLHDWPGLIRPGHRVAATDLVWAVRQDWAAGDHTVVTPRRSRAAGMRAKRALTCYWRPLAVAHCLVRLPLAQVRVHPAGCRDRSCPALAAAMPVEVDR